MEVLHNLMNGFSVVLTSTNILFLIGGCVLGTILGMMPGIGPSTGLALLLPLTFVMQPSTALITMSAIYYGAMFGGSRSSILLNIPGDASAVASCFDGYPMAINGQAEAALAISAIASFIGGAIATIAFVLLALPVARLALKFGPPEYFALMIFALASMVSTSPKAFISLLLGLMITTIGIDPQSGVQRFTFGIPQLQTGIDFVVVIVGIYGMGEVFKNLGGSGTNGKSIQSRFGKIWITMKQWKRCIIPILREAPVGFLIGVLPGAGGNIASMMAYNNEKRLSKKPEGFGKGAIEGLAAPEVANNAASIGAIIPTLTLGIPGSGTAALMLGALIILGIQPGPLLFQQHPDIAWGIIASLFLGNMVCAVINLPLASLLVRVLSIPPKILYPLVAVLSFMGVYSINYSTVDFYFLILLGVIGYFMDKHEMPIAPLILAAVLGPLLEHSFRRSLILSDGSLNIFFRSGVSKIFLLLAFIFVVYPHVANWLKNWQGEKIFKNAKGKLKS